MKGLTAPLAALVIFTLVLARCGGTSRQLQSITISPLQATISQNNRAQFTAAGQFNTSPTNVTPLAVSWMITGPGWDPIPPSYNLTSQPFNPPCNGAGSTYVIIAYAPVDPNAPSSGSMADQVFQDLVMKHTTSSEGGFVASTAQLNCS